MADTVEVAYKPCGSARLIFNGPNARDGELVLAGAAGTGKTRACLEKCHLIAQKYPGVRILFLRKHRTDLVAAALVTFKDQVLHARDGVEFVGASGDHPGQYYYPTKDGKQSTVTIGGLDKDATNIMSREFDLIYCFVSDTQVFSPSRIEKAYSRWYSGPLVTIRTALGNELTGSPNHPILTDHGWVALGALTKGDYVVSRSNIQSIRPGGYPDIQNKPASIADIASALSLAESSRTQRIETIGMDFHGDGEDGNVDIVTAAGVLKRGFGSSFDQPITQDNRLRRDFKFETLMGLGTAVKLHIRRYASRITHSSLLPKRTHAFTILRRVHPHRQRLSRMRFEPLLRFTALFWILKAQLLRFSPGSVRDTSGLQLTDKPFRPNRSRLADLFERQLSGDITLDKIVNVHRIDQAGCRHVHNLQTESHFYFANNIVAHNCQEATELSENDWENITTRLRGEVLPYCQVLADCNPSSPVHWLKQRAEKGLTTMLTSVHKDNPALWDEKKQDWTPRGHQYVVKRLGALTGVRRARLLEGRWAAAEGIVFEGWNRDIHLIPPFAIPKSWNRYIVVDFGFTHAYVAQWWAESEDGIVYCYRQIHKSKRLVEDHARQMLTFIKTEPLPQAIICDHDAEDRATLERHLGMATVAADKQVGPGIQAVQARLRVLENGKARLYVFQTADGYGLVEVDHELELAKKPTCFQDEVEGYVWPDNINGKRSEEPVKKDDDGCDAARYMAQYLDGGTPMSWALSDDEDDWYMSPAFDNSDYEQDLIA